MFCVIDSSLFWHKVSWTLLECDLAWAHGNPSLFDSEAIHDVINQPGPSFLVCCPMSVRVLAGCLVTLSRPSTTGPWWMIRSDRWFVANFACIIPHQFSLYLFLDQTGRHQQKSWNIELAEQCNHEFYHKNWSFITIDNQNWTFWKSMEDSRFHPKIPFKFWTASRYNLNIISKARRKIPSWYLQLSTQWFWKKFI